MPTLEQSSPTGEWRINKLYHQYEEDVAIPVTLTFNGVDVPFIISHDQTKTVQHTGWITRIPVDLADKTRLEQEVIDGITFVSGVVMSDDGTKRYKISNINWTASAYTPSEDNYRIEVRPDGLSASTNDSCVNFRAWWINERTLEEIDITNTADWSTETAGARFNSPGVLCYNNTSTSNSKVITVKATKNGQYDIGKAYFPKKEVEPEPTVYGTLRCTGGTPTSASINVNGSNKGSYTGGTISYGSYEVGTTVTWSASKVGYTGDSGRITIHEGNNDFAYELEEITPETKYGILQFSGNVTNVTITIDGVDYTYNGGIYEIMSGSTTMKYAEGTNVGYTLTKSGYETITDSIRISGNIAGDEPNLVVFEMEEEATYDLYWGDQTSIDNQHYTATTCTGSLQYNVAWCDNNDHCTAVTEQATWTVITGEPYITVVNGLVRFNNTGNTTINGIVRVSYSKDGSEGELDIELQVPPCQAIVDHCTVRTSVPNITFTGAGTNSVIVSAVTYYTNGTSAYTEPTFEWVPETCDSLIITDETSRFYIKNVVTTGKTGSGPYIYSFTLPPTETNKPHGGTVRFGSADCSDVTTDMCMKYDKPIVYPTVTVETYYPSSSQYGLSFMFDTLNATTGRTWKVTVSNAQIDVRYIPDSTTGEITATDTLSFSFTGRVDDVGMLQDVALIGTPKSNLFGNVELNLHQTGDSVWVWVPVQQPIEVTYAYYRPNSAMVTIGPSGK